MFSKGPHQEFLFLQWEKSLQHLKTLMEMNYQLAEIGEGHLLEKKKTFFMMMKTMR